MYFNGIYNPTKNNIKANISCGQSRDYMDFHQTDSLSKFSPYSQILLTLSDNVYLQVVVYY